MDIVIESWITSEHLGDDKLTKKLPQMTTWSLCDASPYSCGCITIWSASCTHLRTRATDHTLEDKQYSICFTGRNARSQSIAHCASPSSKCCTVVGVTHPHQKSGHKSPVGKSRLSWSFQRLRVAASLMRLWLLLWRHIQVCDPLNLQIWSGGLHISAGLYGDSTGMIWRIKKA